LLNQRRNQGKAFSETEIRQFLQQLLPVLAHIHAKGIIHRDISPDNIMLRRSDQLPVLIDFGVVKEVVTRLQMEGPEAPPTTVGKVGYAPSEQMQTGRAYPSSDLYSLAVTAVVLLTGREPQEMFDDVNLTWNWQQYAQVSPQLAQVLNRALNYRPGDRFQSVSQMVQALSGQAPPPAAPPPIAAAPPASELRTVAVGRPAPTTPQTRAVTQSPATDQTPGMLENPWAVTALGVGSAVVAGIGGWAVVNYLNAGPTPTPTPTMTPLPPIESTPFPSPTETPSPRPPREYDQALTLAPDQPQTVEGALRGGDKINYTFTAEAGQTLSTSLAEEGVLLSVLNSDGSLVTEDAGRVRRWNGELPADGDYRIQLSPVEGLSRSDYQLAVSLTAAPTPEPTSTDTPTEQPTPPSTETPPPQTQPDILEQRVQFPSGQNGTLVSNSVGPGRIRRYVLNAQQGQIITVKFTQANGPATFDVQLPSGELMEDAAGVLFWQSYLPLGGDYAIDVKSPTATEFTLEIRVTAQPE
jgi:serine/threonine-protein kinase